MNPERTPLLETPSGTVSGSLRPSGTAVFRAVPVAAPHTDTDTRFAAPRPAPAWDGVRDCTDSREQLARRATSTATVYAPVEATAGGSVSAPRPVVVFIHGGRYEAGHADELWYDGEALVKQGCIVVTVNYRKRFEGFLPLDDSTDNSPPHFRAVDDLLHALHWVHTMCDELGGDTGNVTLAGQSAGGGLIAWLLTLREADPLFHRAVIMSPGLPRGGGPRRWLSARLALMAPGRPTDPLPRDYIDSLSPNQLQTAYRRFASVHSTDCAVGPYPLDVSALRPVPVMIGTMHDEFVTFPLVKDVDRVLRRVLHTLRLPQVVASWLLAPTMLVLGVPLRTLRSWCRFAAAEEPVRPLGRTVGDRMIRRWASAIADGLAAAGSDVWAYEFIGGRDGAKVGELGHYALHCGELPQLFDRLTVGRADVAGACGPDAVERLGGDRGTASRFRQSVINFAHGRTPDWGKYTLDQRNAQVYDMSGEPGTASAATVTDPWRQVRELLGRLY